MNIHELDENSRLLLYGSNMLSKNNGKYLGKTIRKASRHI